MKRPLCGKCEAGWVYTEPVNPADPDNPPPATVTRCPCRLKPSPEQERDEAAAAVALAHPNAFNDAVRIIRDAATVNLHLSANTVRDAMDAAQITGPVLGAAFRKCVAEGWIEVDGLDKSTLQNTKAHRIFRYRSRMFLPQQLGVGT